ncbi:MAG: FCD domain-containing protein [Pseudomonadota bacterium]
MADRLFQGIAAKIVAMIDEGELAPGARLPGERDLAERFGVSRVTVREAEIALQAVGIIEIKTGSGVYVAERAASAGSALPQVSAFELTEARALFEAEAAALAAPIIAEERLGELERLLAIMASEGGDTERSTDADREFHALIASASGNQAVIHVIRELWRLRTEVPAVRDAHAAVCKSDVRARQEEHEAIVSALRQRDPQAARVAMRRHFRRLLEAMLDEDEQRAMSELKRQSAQSRQRFQISAQI